MTSNLISIHTTRNYADSIVQLGAMSHGSIPSVISTGTAYLAIHRLISSLLASIFASTIHWTLYDPFFRQKDEAFKSSKQCVLELVEHFGAYAARARFQGNDAAQQKLVFVPPPTPPDHVIALPPTRALTLISRPRRKWRIFVFGAMPPIFHLRCKATSSIGRIQIETSSL